MVERLARGCGLLPHRGPEHAGHTYSKPATIAPPPNTATCCSKPAPRISATPGCSRQPSRSTSKVPHGDPGGGDARHPRGRRPIPLPGCSTTWNRERDWLPAFAVSADLGRPVGQGGRSAETGLTVIAAKTLTPSVDRWVHLHVAWLSSLDPDEEKRRDRCRVVVGYSQLVAPDVAANVVEAGLRCQLNERATLGAGAGFGIGRDSPGFRAVFSVQVGFGGWWRHRSAGAAPLPSRPHRRVFWRRQSRPQTPAESSDKPRIIPVWHQRHQR